MKKEEDKWKLVYTYKLGLGVTIPVFNNGEVDKINVGGVWWETSRVYHPKN